MMIAIINLLQKKGYIILPVKKIKLMIIPPINLTLVIKKLIYKKFNNLMIRTKIFQKYVKKSKRMLDFTDFLLKLTQKNLIRTIA